VFSTYEPLQYPGGKTIAIKTTKERGNVTQWYIDSSKSVVDLPLAQTSSTAYDWLVPSNDLELLEPGSYFDPALSPTLLGVYKKVEATTRHTMSIPLPQLPTLLGDTYSFDQGEKTVVMSSWREDKESRSYLERSVALPQLWAVKQVLDQYNVAFTFGRGFVKAYLAWGKLVKYNLLQGVGIFIDAEDYKYKADLKQILSIVDALNIPLP